MTHTWTTKLTLTGAAAALALGATACQVEDDDPVPTQDPAIEPGEDDPILDGEVDEDA